MTIGPIKPINSIASTGTSTSSEEATIGSLSLVMATAGSAVVEAASASTDILTVTFPVSVGADANTVSLLLTTNGSDALSVTEAGEVITVALADTTATNNTAALIQIAIRALTTTDAGVSLAGVTCVAGGNWDKAAIATGEAAAVDFTGGTDSAETTLTPYQQLNNIIVVTDANSDENIIANPIAGKSFIVQNDTVHTITIKASGQTGVSVPTLRKIYVYGNGTDFVDFPVNLAKKLDDGADPVNAVVAGGVLTITASPVNGESFVIGTETFDIHGDAVTAYAGANTPVDITGAATAAQATEELTISGVVIQGETVTIGTDIYEFDADGTATETAVDISSYATASQGLLTTNAGIIHDNTLVVAGTTTTLKADGTAASAIVIDIEQAASSARATAVLTIVGLPVDAETFTIGTDEYEFDPTGDGLAGAGTEIDTNGLTTIAQIVDQIETDYNAHVGKVATAVSDGIDTVTFTYNIAGVAGNAIASTTVLAAGAFGDTTFSGGVAATAGELATLIHAHYVFGGPGAEATVLATASDAVAGTVTFTAVTPGTAGDAITTTDTLTAGGFDAVTLGTETAGVDCTAENAQIALSAQVAITGLLATQPYSFGTWAINASTLTMHNVGVEGNGLIIEETGANMAWTGGNGVTDGGVDATAAELEVIIAALTPSADVTLAVDGAGTTTVIATAGTAGTIGNIVTTSAATGLAWAAGTLTGGVNGTIGEEGEVRYNSTTLYICTADNTIADANWIRNAGFATF